MTDCELFKTLVREHRLHLATIAGMACLTSADIFSCVDGRRKIPKVIWSAIYELTADMRARNRCRDTYDGILSSDDTDPERPPDQVTVAEIAVSMRLFAAMSTTLTEFFAARSHTQRLAARDRYETAFAQFTCHANAVNVAVYQSFTTDGSNACQRK